jgi:pyruvate/2-oxoglutarate/acetoin dehydrogenase E1 component
VSIAVEEAFDSIDGPPIRITTPHIPLPHAGVLEDAAIPSVDRIADIVAQQLI